MKHGAMERRQKTLVRGWDSILQKYETTQALRGLFALLGAWTVEGKTKVEIGLFVLPNGAKM